MNTNTIQVKEFFQIQIRILFGLRNLAEYEYELRMLFVVPLFLNTNTMIVKKNAEYGY